MVAEEKFGIIKYYDSLTTITPLEKSTDYCYKPDLSPLSSKLIPVAVTDNICVIDALSIVSKCVCINLQKCMYVAVIPNNLFEE